MNGRKQFVRGMVVMFLPGALFLSLEFYWEWDSLGRPGFTDLSWAGTNNAKLVDVLSPMARAYNNILAILLATIGLAIPLTANMHTPKLIDMFLRDRVNLFMLGLSAFGAAHVLWTDYLIGPNFAPLWAYRLSVLGALFGWLTLVPYFYYVMRFLDPSNILARLKGQITQVIDQSGRGRVVSTVAHDLVRERLHHIGTIVLKSIGRGDRGVVQEGIWLLKQLLDHYGDRKPRLPAHWFLVERKDFVGMTAEAIEIINEDRTWFEHCVMTQLLLAYQSALASTQDVISSLSDAARVIATRAAQRADDKTLALAVRFFNNYLREAIKRKDLHAIYDLMCQYRLLAFDLDSHPQFVAEIGLRIRVYSEMAVGAGLDFVPQIASFDLKAMICHAYEHRSPAAPALLGELLSIKHQTAAGWAPLVIKAKAILGGFFLENDLKAEAAKVRENLAGAPKSELDSVERDLLSLTERSFWEVTDRQVNFEWVPLERRPALKKFIHSI